jgi:hypothetical protein
MNSGWVSSASLHSLQSTQRVNFDFTTTTSLHIVAKLSLPITFLFDVAVLKVTNKVQHMNTLERYYIHNEEKKGTQINNKNNVNENNNSDILVH